MSKIKLVVEMTEQEHTKLKDGRLSVTMMRSLLLNGIPLEQIHDDESQHSVKDLINDFIDGKYDNDEEHRQYKEVQDYVKGLLSKPQDADRAVSLNAVKNLILYDTKRLIPYEYEEDGKKIRGWDTERYINVTKLEQLPSVSCITAKDRALDSC